MRAMDLLVASPSRRLLFVIAFCLVASLYAMTLARSQWAKMSNDETVYLDSARQITRIGCPVQSVGVGYVFLDNPPLVPYLTALARWGWGDSLQALRSASVSVWVLPAYIGTFLLAARMFGLAAGLVALVALYSQRRFMISAAFVELDVPLAALSILFLYSLYHVANPVSDAMRRRASVACGVIAGLACLTKYQGALLPVMGVSYLVLASRLRLTQAIRENGLPCGAMLAGAGVAAVAWYSLATHCGGDLIGAIGNNLARVTFQTSEPWFHQELLGLDGYWMNLLRMLGPVVGGGGVIAAVLWGRRLIEDPRLKLLGMWVLISFVFCSAIGLRAERYFFSAGLAVAVLVGSLGSREVYEGNAILRANPKWLTGLRVVLVTGVVVCSAYAASEFLKQTKQLEQQDPNSRYEALADVVRGSIKQEERFFSTSPQIAYLADRSYFASQWEPDGRQWIHLASDPKNRVQLMVFASNPILHEGMATEQRERVTRYVREHFVNLPVGDLGGQVLRRVSY